MRILLTDAGKRYNRDWIFRHLNFHFEPARSYSITGPNGSGKSTLLQVLAGAIQVSEGKMQIEKIMEEPVQPVNPDHLFRFISYAAPYLELIEEMNLAEFLEFHNRFKPLLPGAEISGIIERLGLKEAAMKQIRYYSSGMKQRVKLAQAIFSHTPILLLDEPCTNLDEDGVQLYLQLIHQYGKERLIIVGSNDPAEYSFCEENLRITDFKNTKKN